MGEHKLFIHSLSMGIWVASQFWRIWINLLWTVMYKSLYGDRFSSLLGKYLRARMVNFVKHCQIVFQSGFTVFHCCQKGIRILVAVHPLQYLVFVGLLNFSFPSGCVEISHVIFICNSLMTSSAEHLFMSFWPLFLILQSVHWNVLLLLGVYILIFDM